MTTLPHIAKRKSVYNSHHWRWFWRCKDRVEKLDEITVKTWWDMFRELNEIKYKNNKYEKYRK